MKILHCADLHLDSRLETNLKAEKAKKRRNEILNKFAELVEYANENEIMHIIIAGDLFDRDNVSTKVQNVVIGNITKYPNIQFYYLRGNHDSNNFITSLDVVPENLHMFEDEWKTYYIESETSSNFKVAVTGVELTFDNNNKIYSFLHLNSDEFNIVVLHGQENEHKSKDRAEVISRSDLRNKNIDYLALGHVHKYERGELDARGIYCYPGCLEGRGFDELGVHGFVVLDINEDTKELRDDFIAFSTRCLYEVAVDISECMTTIEVLEKINAELSQIECTKEDMIKIILTGEVDVNIEKSISYMTTNLEQRFFFVKIYDESTLAVDVKDYSGDVSLKGEFVRLVSGLEDIDEEKKAAIIRCGIKALDGEEINKCV
ncbi:metallophosphoesterase family protein [Lachnospira multipara]|uniref:DNA repair exonuclease SbcCD nuclease subunit n=1 Tax=Lachnospira multipara TaxID=28051 RepID=A0A1H5WE09_9FIRM|nr:DNA repair exonuclease [Lachnospira multipara]SEF97702.1 DNA repair exonuclease SbcCD nuclease subunit [Lachnospira multipara]